MDIRILPSNIANLIAAGEVVQRPASVVKELMENAVDAGAAQISVIITDAGRTLIQVIDDGCGMSPDQAVLCFERHATSKIAAAEDLERIRTFGFRGEALASIAAVAEVTLRTRRPEDETGCQVEFADSRHLATVETACPSGSNFAVRNLFYNVPARRKFLKSDNVEFKHIVEEFSRVALTRPELGFSLLHNGREVFSLKPAKSLKYRIQDVMGKQVAAELVEVHAETSVATVTGYVGRPDLARKTLGNQFFFINGRYFRSPYLHKAVMKAYEHLVPEGATPSYFIYLQADPGSFDVNIHPTKTEIKFEEDTILFQILQASVKEALGTNSFGASIEFGEAAADALPVFGKDFERYRPVSGPPPVAVDPSYNPFEAMIPGDSGGGDGNRALSGARYAPPSYVDTADDYGKLFEDKTLPTTSVILVQGRYIVMPAQSGLLVVHIRRARERILYERFLRAVTTNAHVSQAALFPVQVTVGADNRLVFEEHAALLQTLGFDITPFGADTVVVNGIPEGFSCDSKGVEALLADVLLALTDDPSALPAMVDTVLAERFARIGAARGGAVTSPAEARRLVDTLFACEESSVTSRGNKIMRIISVDDVEKLF